MISTNVHIAIETLHNRLIALWQSQRIDRQQYKELMSVLFLAAQADDLLQQSIKAVSSVYVRRRAPCAASLAACDDLQEALQ